MSALDLVLRGLEESKRTYLAGCEWVDGEVAQAFRAIAARRGWFAAALEVAFHDGDSRAVAANAPREDPRLSLSDRLAPDQPQLLSEFEHAEAELLARYRRILANELPADLALLLAEQYAEIRGTHEALRAARYEEEWARS